MNKETKKRASAEIDCVPKMPFQKKRTARQWQLDLYIAGETPKSAFVFANLKKVCETYLPGQYLIKVVDIVKNPQRAATEHILALPMVVRRLPVPIKRVIGDMSQMERVLTGLDIPAVRQD